MDIHVSVSMAVSVDVGILLTVCADMWKVCCTRCAVGEPAYAFMHIIMCIYMSKLIVSVVVSSLQ